MATETNKFQKVKRMILTLEFEEDEALVFVAVPKIGEEGFTMEVIVAEDVPDAGFLYARYMPTMFGRSWAFQIPNDVNVEVSHVGTERR